MSATIKSIFLCPRCEEGITSIETTTVCPNCALPLGKQILDAYTPPYTLSEQNEKYKDQERFARVVSELPIAKANSMLNDALVILETVPGKINRIEDIRYLVETGIRIGNIATGYQKFLEAGGKHFPSFFIKPETEQQQQENQENQNEPARTKVDAIASTDTGTVVGGITPEMHRMWDQPE